MGKVNYYINGIDIRTYGIHVEAGKGLLSLPERKAGVSHSYDNEHGISVDTGSCFVKERKITLSCFTDKLSHAQFQTTLQNFKSLLMTAGLFQLQLVVEGATHPLVFMVYWSGKVDVSAKYNGASQVGTFDVILTEPEPVKRVWKVVATAASEQISIGLTSGPSKYYNIYWGDGSSDPNKTIADAPTHTYTNAGTYYVVLTGDISNLSTSASAGSNSSITQIWNLSV